MNARMVLDLIKCFVLIVVQVWLFRDMLVQISTNKAASAAPGSPTNELRNQVVSYINATCQADPLNCTGSYHSESSWALLYVPENVGTASLTINDVGNGVSTITIIFYFF